VGVGFGFAALVGIPLGFAIGRFAFLNRDVRSGHFSLLRPVSPLAWLPIGLLVFKQAPSGGDLDHLHLFDLADDHQHRGGRAARAAGLHERGARARPRASGRSVTKILFPAVLPYLLTGVRLAVGTAWLVIVAAEMLTGGVGIGFWIWDEWNNLNVASIIIAIFVIGIVGLVLEFGLIKLATLFTFEEVKS
jgi:nitrate/nitrite transport system permease protein